MIDINDLEVGMRVRIVSEWCDGCHQNNQGAMDSWLGSIMTIRKIEFDQTYRTCVKMEEDRDEWNDGWSWYLASIAEIVEEPKIEPATEEEFFGLLLE